jgi:hypothetical protein
MQGHVGLATYGPQPDRLTAQLRHCSRNKLQGFTQASLHSTLCLPLGLDLLSLQGG